MSDKNKATGDQTTGHLWDDDLADLTNQPPKWWLLGLAASAIWVVVYWIYYPSIPVAVGNDYFKGVGGWSAIKELEQDMGEVKAARQKYEDQLKDMTPAAILADAELSKYVQSSGKVLFGDFCAACHGQNGIGTKDNYGYMAPVLNDDDWLFGGNVDSIHESIKSGRMGMMMGFGNSLSEAEIDQLAKAIEQGKPTSTPLFVEKGCSGCHGEDGKGMAALGSANLADQAWRFDGSYEGIKYTIINGVNDTSNPKTRVAEMPSFEKMGKLSETDMKKLAVYVHMFGGGVVEAAAAAPAAEPTPATEAAPADAAPAPAADAAAAAEPAKAG